MNKTKILVADDDRSICTLIKLILEKEGFEVSCLFDGESVVNEIAAGGKYDLIILDIMMPEMLGTNAAKKIKDICDTPIIFITARSSDEDKIEAYESGADDYLCKPFSSVELVLRVKAVLKRTKTKYKEEIEFLHSEKSVVIQGNKIILTDTELRLCFLVLTTFRHTENCSSLLTAKAAGRRSMICCAGWNKPWKSTKAGSTCCTRIRNGSSGCGEP